MSYQVGFVTTETNEILCKKCSDFYTEKMRVFEDNSSEELCCDSCDRVLEEELRLRNIEWYGKDKKTT